MHLVHFACRHFRCLHDLSFHPQRGVNVIRGRNAQGKTSLLEAILFTATSKSHRTNVENELVTHGQEGCHLCATAQRADREVTIEAHWWRGMKRVKVNRVSQTRVSDILGKIAVVLFSPDDIVLIKGTAAHRRKFLDMELSQINPAYLNALQRYRHALRQRNELLRAYKPDPDLLDVWDAQLADHGAVLVRERRAFLNALGERASDAYGRIAEREQFALEYRPDATPENGLGAVLAKARGADLRRQATTRGPHRDDFRMDVAGSTARNFGSQGQQKTAALALKLAELGLVKERTGEYPVLMLDEVLSELDERRSRRLFEAIDDQVQCLATTTDVARHRGLFGERPALYRIERGRLEEA